MLSLICFALIGITLVAAEPMLDITRQQVRTSVKYHILPVSKGKGGGQTAASSANSTCPLFVVQEKLEVLNGTPVTFTPFNAKDDVILTSIDLNIKSSVTSTTFSQSPVWKFLKVLSGVWFISTSGVEGNPGANTIVNWFKIEKVGKDYQFSFCHSVCKCSTLCRALGIFIDSDGSNHLAHSNQVPPFKVMFKRA